MTVAASFRPQGNAQMHGVGRSFGFGEQNKYATHDPLKTSTDNFIFLVVHDDTTTSEKIFAEEEFRFSPFATASVYFPAVHQFSTSS